MSGAIVEAEIAPGLLHWTLDNPDKRNAVTPAMLAWLGRRAGELRGEVVLLDAAPGPCFCAGYDLDALPEGQDPLDVPPDDPLIAASLALQSADAITIAVIHADVFGAGVELVAACDLRFAAPTARFTVPVARLGVVYHHRGVALLHRVFGPALARRLLLLADSVAADEAHRAGALAGLHPVETLRHTARDVADRLRQGAPLSVRAHRDLLRALDRGDPAPELVAAHEDARRTAYASDDFREGRTAARLRRAPKFTGR